MKFTDDQIVKLAHAVYSKMTVDELRKTRIEMQLQLAVLDRLIQDKMEVQSDV